jgi:hypothetical protein
MPMTLLNSLKPKPSSHRGAPTARTLLTPVQDLWEIEPPVRENPVQQKDTAWRYGSEEALKKALEAKGAGAFVIGVRKLDGWIPLHNSPDGSWADRKNVERNHQHLFYLDADGEFHHVGFFRPSDRTGKDGGIVFDNPTDKDEDKKWMGSVGQYHFGPVLEGGEITKEKLQLKGFSPKDYSLTGNNCQDYIAELQRDVLISGRAPQE